MKGIKQYTQHTVAFPSLQVLGSSPAVFDDINVGWNYKDGGTYGEFKIELYKFGGQRDLFGRQPVSYSAAIHCFNDGMKLLVTDEIQELTRWLSRNRSALSVNPNIADKIIDKLESLGFKPSEYHLKGRKYV